MHVYVLCDHRDGCWCIGTNLIDCRKIVIFLKGLWRTPIHSYFIFKVLLKKRIRIEQTRGSELDHIQNGGQLLLTSWLTLTGCHFERGWRARMFQLQTQLLGFRSLYFV